jgi:hypothetical protein
MYAKPRLSNAFERLASLSWPDWMRVEHPAMLCSGLLLVHCFQLSRGDWPRVEDDVANAITSATILSLCGMHCSSTTSFQPNATPARYPTQSKDRMQLRVSSDVSGSSPGAAVVCREKAPNSVHSRKSASISSQLIRFGIVRVRVIVKSLAHLSSVPAGHHQSLQQRRRREAPLFKFLVHHMRDVVGRIETDEIK